MISWCVVDSSGYPVSGGRGETVPPGGVELPDWLDAIQAMKYRLDNVSWVPRPEIDAPSVTDLAPGVSIEFAGVPEGTSCVVIDRETGDILATEPESGGAIMIELPESGSYLLTTTAPLPWLPHEYRIDVP